MKEEKLKDTIYIHYGSDSFNPYAVGKIGNSGLLTKPDGGLWASREDDAFGWKQWCEDNHFYLERLRHSFRFRLSPSCRLLLLENPEQLKSLPKLHDWSPKDYTEMFEFEASHPGEIPSIDQLNRWFAPNLCYLDFEKLAQEYDALELRNACAFRDSLQMWDCDSIVIFKPEVIDLV